MLFDPLGGASVYFLHMRALGGAPLGGAPQFRDKVGGEGGVQVAYRFHVFLPLWTWSGMPVLVRSG